MNNNSIKSEQGTSKSKSKLDLAKEIIEDVEQGLFPIDPCETCHLIGFCCGCPKERKYENRHKPYEEILGEDAVEEAVAIGELKLLVSKAQKEIKHHQEKLKLFISSKYIKMQKLKEELTNLFGDFDE